MKLKTLCWLTDIHLNFLEHEERIKFYEQVMDRDADAVLITGDIAEAHNVCNLLQEFSDYLQKSIFFVLGNHDYYRGNVEEVRKAISQLCESNPYLKWLNQPVTVALNDTTVLLGVDGWADARYGDYDNSRVRLNDNRFIADLFQASTLGRTQLRNKMQALADDDASMLKELISKALQPSLKKMIIATHVPPYAEACWYEGKQSGVDWQPFFSTKASGDVITAAAIENSGVEFVVLCGHTHTAHEYKPRDNVIVKVGGAEYFHPEVEAIIQIDAVT